MPELNYSSYKWFSDNDFDDEADVRRIISCSKANQELLLEIIGPAKDDFAKTLDIETELTENTFSIPLEQEFGEKYEQHSSPKHVLQPYYRFRNVCLFSAEAAVIGV